MTGFPLRASAETSGEPKKGYILVEIEVTDSVRYRDYMALSLKAVQDFGGRFLVRGGDPKTVEGDRPLSRAVIVEFESFERAQAFYESAQYQRAAAVRRECAVTHYYLLHGA